MMGPPRNCWAAADVCANRAPGGGVEVQGGGKHQGRGGWEDMGEEERLERDQTERLLVQVNDVGPLRAQRLCQSRQVQVPRAVAGKSGPTNAPGCVRRN